MKKIFYALVSIVTLLGCSKSDECNCGEILKDKIETVSGDKDYFLQVQNDCTNNIEWFQVSSEVYWNNYAGDDYCFNDVDNW